MTEKPEITQIVEAITKVVEGLGNNMVERNEQALRAVTAQLRSIEVRLERLEKKLG